jgi:putative membrane protein
MSAALRTKDAVFAAGLSYLLAVGYAQAQQVDTHQAKPVQYADQDTAQPLSTDQQGSQQGERSTTFFRGPDTGGTTASSPTSEQVDRQLANCLLIKNQAEIEANKFGAERAESDEVRQFAQQMVRDHEELAQELSQIAGSSRQYDAQSRTDARTSTTNATAGGSDTLAQLLAIDRQISKRCNELMREKLEQKSGAEFDRCFVGAQIGGHIHMLAALDVISQQSGAKLQQVAQKAKPKVEQHLKHAEDLAKQLESQSAETSQRQARRQ